MSGKPYIRHRGWCPLWMASAVLLMATWTAGTVKADPPPSPSGPIPAKGGQDGVAPLKMGESNPGTPGQSSSAARTETAPTAIGEIIQTGCTTCGSGLLGKRYHEGIPTGAVGPSMTFGGSGHPCNNNCIPGRFTCCSDCNCSTAVGQFFCELYRCICCPDPCYEPRWIAVADQAFFQDNARPVTQSRFRIDNAFNFRAPDRGEYFWARVRTNPNQVGPAGPCAPANIPGKGPTCIVADLDYDEITQYTEAGTQTFSAFFEWGYRHIDPRDAFINAEFGQPCCPVSGFTDINFGTKSVLLDCELIVFTFQFKSYMPTGAFTKGLGTGHVSLEPSFLANIKLSPVAYAQTQLAYWIPIAGDPLYQSEVYRWHLSLNRELWCPCPGVTIIGNIESTTLWFHGGAFTSPDLVLLDANNNRAPVALSANTTIVTLGPGIRVNICDKLDLGVGAQFAVTDTNLAETMIRTELRLRF